MQFTDSQRAAIDQDGADMVVVAGAGSGKTRVLVERYVRLLERHDADRLLAITFTDKAAREMRDRVRQRLEQRARAAQGPERARWGERLAALEGARIGTIHSFCATLLRAHPAETGLDPRFGLLDEVQAGLLLYESIGAALRQRVEQIAPVEDDEVLRARSAALAEFGLGELRGLVADLLRKGEQGRAALEALPPTPEQLLERWRAAAALSRREALAELRADPRWRAAAAEVRALAAAAPADDTLGAQLAAAAPLLEALERPDFDGYTQLARLGQFDLRLGAAKRWGGKEQVQAAREAARALGAAYQPYAALLELEWDEALEQRAAAAVLDLAHLSRLALEHYRARKREQAALDFDDLEHLAVELLRSHAHVRARWQRELAAVLVDEFQDTNAEQRDLAYLLAGRPLGPEAGSGPPERPPQQAGKLFVVGDGKQSIYRFRGADVGVLSAVRRDLAATGGREIALDTSFRAHGRLVALINALFARVFARAGGLRDYEVAFEPLRGFRPPAPHAQVAEIHLVRRPGRGQPGGSAEELRLAEAQILARRIRALVEQGAPLVEERGSWRPLRYGDIAMLFQASTVFDVYEEALRAEGVPFLTTAGRGYYGRDEVRDLIHLLRVLEDPTDDFALAGALRSPLFALDDAAILRLRLGGQPSLWAALADAGNGGVGKYPSAAAPSSRAEPGADLEGEPPELRFARETLQGLLSLRGRVAVVELLRAALSATGYLATVSGLRDGERRRVNIEKLLSVTRRAGTTDLATLGAYLEDVLRQEAREGEAPLEGEHAVRLMTVHRAKGLEFPAVVLPDLGRESPRLQPLGLAGRGYGLALKLRDGPDWRMTLAYRLAQAQEARMERAERERLAYVALTRARDYLIVAGPSRERGGEDWLSWLLAALGWPWEQGGPPDGVHPVAGGALDLLVLRHGSPESGEGQAGPSAP